MNTITIGNTSYQVLYTTKPGRVIIRYDGGLIVLADQNRDGTWDLSGQPASTEEQAVITSSMPAVDTTEVDIVKDQARPKAAAAESAPDLNPFLKNSAVHKFCDTMYRYTFGWLGEVIEGYEARQAKKFFTRLEKSIDGKQKPAPTPAVGTDPTSVPNP